MFIRKPVYTLQFDEKDIFNQEIGVVVADGPILIAHFESGLSYGSDVTEFEFAEQCAFVDLFEESRSKYIGDLKDGPDHTLS